MPYKNREKALAWTNIDFMLEVLARAAVARRELCGIRKTRILAAAQTRMCDEEIACWQDLIRFERQIQTLRGSASPQAVGDLWGAGKFDPPPPEAASVDR